MTNHTTCGGGGGERRPEFAAIRYITNGDRVSSMQRNYTPWPWSRYQHRKGIGCWSKERLKFLTTLITSSLVSIVTRLRAGRSGFDFRWGQRRDVLLFATAPRHTVGYVGTWGFSLWIKLPGREPDHSPPSSAEVKNAWSYTSIPATCLHGVVLN
jgi:hypothetical protein